MPSSEKIAAILPSVDQDCAAFKASSVMQLQMLGQELIAHGHVEQFDTVLQELFDRASNPDSGEQLASARSYRYLEGLIGNEVLIHTQDY